MATLIVTHGPDVADAVTAQLVANGATHIEVTGSATTASLDEDAARTVGASLFLGAKTVAAVRVDP